MTLRSYDPASPTNTYNADAEISYCEDKIYEILAYIGMSDVDISELTIDEIVAGVRGTIPFTRLDMDNGVYTITAGGTELNALNIRLVSSARRHWYRYNVAKAVRDNA